MSAESFKILKEINSLSMRRNELLEIELKEKKRIVFIQNNRNDREELLAELEDKLKANKSELTQTENQINTLSQKIEKDSTNLESLVDETSINSLHKQINEMKEKLDSNEELGLELLDSIEETEKEIIECKDFLKGSLETLTEIKSEVEQTIAHNQKEIDSLIKRESLLKEELPIKFKSKIELILKKNIQISSFTRIKSESCEFCRFNLSKMDIISIEDNLNIKSCQGCSRIFLPIQSAYS